jgi:hypothetical protein
MPNICGKKKFTYVLEFDIKVNGNTPTSLNVSCKPNKKSCRNAIKGAKLTEKYIEKMEKLGYKVENARYDKGTPTKDN